MAKYTEGPWMMISVNPETYEGPFGTLGEPIAVVGGEINSENLAFVVGRGCDLGPHGNEQTKANAQLIAAAPELFEACIEAIKYLSGNPHDPEGIRNKTHSTLLTALARATGQITTEHPSTEFEILNVSDIIDAAAKKFAIEEKVVESCREYGRKLIESQQRKGYMAKGFGKAKNKLQQICIDLARRLESNAKTN